jgi:Protein of unknown function (DUF664)
MDVNELLVESFGRIPDLVRAAVEGMDPEDLARRPAPDANPIGWLVWHLVRVQDDHVAEVMGSEQVWTSGGWPERFGLPAGYADTGYGHTPQDVAAVRPENAQALLDYLDAVWERTRGFLLGLKPADLDRVVDERWDPPVTLGVRLVSVVDDDAQHAGQAAYVRGLLERGR